MPVLYQDMLTKNRLKEKVQPVATRLAGIANPYRLAVVYLLATDELLNREIVDALGLPPSLVSHHLNILLTTGWITKTKVGKRVTYKLNEKTFESFRRLFADTQFGRQFFKNS